MERSPERAFLEMHMSEIIENTRTPDKLADHLLEKNAISKEMYNNIRAQKTNQDKMREIYKNLNSRKAFDCAYEWLKKNEHHLIEELGINSDTENGAPERKRSKKQNDEAMGKNDNVNISDLKNINTIAKLEKWVSDPENNQRVIDKLKKKIAKSEMEALEMGLKTMKMKKCLRFTADDVNKINNDESLQLYLDTTEDAKFPLKFTLDMLFEKISSRAPPANVSSLECSGYGSSCNSSLKSNQSQNTDGSPHTQAQNNDMPLHKSIDTHESAQNHCSTQFVKTNTLPKSDLKKQNNDLGHKICPNEPIIQLKTSDNDATPTEEDMDIHTGLGVTNRHFDMVAPNAGLFPSSNCAAVLAVVPVQNVILQDKHKSEKFPLTTGNKLHEPPHEPPPAIKHTDALPYNFGQNEPFIQQQPEINDDIPLDKSTGMQESAENHCFSEFEKTRPLNKKAMDNEFRLDETDGYFNTEARNTEQFPSSTSAVVADGPVQNLDLDELKTDNCVLIKVAKTDGSPQTPVVKHTDALAYNLGKNKPFNQQQPETYDDMTLDIFTDKLESAENHCFSEFEKTSPLDKTSHNDATPTEEAMDNEIGLDETNRHFYSETLNTEQFPSRTSTMVASAPDQHKSKNIPLTKVAATEESSASVPKHADVLPGNLGHNKPFIQLQAETDDMPLHNTIGKQESAENDCFAQTDMQPETSYLKNQTNSLDHEICLNEPIIPIKTSENDATLTEEAMDIEVGLHETNRHVDTETLNTEHISSTTSVVVADAPEQNVSLQDKHISVNCPLNKATGSDGSPHTSVPEHADVLPGGLEQNKPFLQFQVKNNDDTPLTKTMDMQEKVCEPNKFTSVVLKGQTEVQAPISSEPGQSLPSVSGQGQHNFSSTPLNDSTQRKDDRKKLPQKNKLEENKERDRMFKDWAKCNSNSEGGLKKLLDGITIINNAEHHDYPFFTAENVWVYENPENDEKQILVVTNQKRFSDKIKNLAHYQMLLCSLKKAIIIGQAELNIVLNKSKVPVDLCLKIISEAFIPALAVFKNMQRKKELYSLL